MKPRGLSQAAAAADRYLIKDRLERRVPAIEKKRPRAALRPKPTAAIAEVTEHARVLEILHRNSVAASGVVDVNKLSQLTVLAAAELVDANGALLRWYEADQDRLRLLGSTCDREWAPMPAVETARSVLGAAFIKRTPVLMNDIQSSDQIDDSVRLEDVTAMVAIPLLVGDRAVGALGVISYGERRFNETDARILSLLGHQVAAAIETAGLTSKLLASEARFRGAFEGSAIGMMVSERRGLVVQVNRAICEMLGEPSSHLLGKRPRDLVDPLDLEALERALQSLDLATSGHGTAEVRFRHRDGREVWGRLNVSVVAGGEGDSTYVVSQVEDITQIRAAEADLVASEVRNKAVIKAALDGLIVVDRHGRIIEFNPAAARILGQSSEAALGRDVFELMFPPRLSERYRETLRRAVAAGARAEVGRFEPIARRADGSELPIELSLFRLETSAEPCFAVSIRDLTERDQLTNSRARLAEVVAWAPVILFAFGTDGRVTLAEGSLLERFGPASDRFLGTDVFDAARQLPGTQEHIERGLAGESYSGQIDLPAIDLWLQASYRPIRDAAGTVVGVSGIALDISDRIRGEVSRQESDAKSRLVAMVNHEIRTPLNSVIGFAELLRLERAGPLNEKQLRYITNVETGGRHLLALINDSLDLSKIAAGKMDMEINDVDLAPILAQAAEQVQPLVEAKGLKLWVRPVKTDWVVRADRRRLLQILWNLLSNAIRHTAAGGTITIDVKGVDERVRVLVSDTGVGIASDQMGKIFEEYTQVAGAQEGTGLGLPVSRRLALLMAGDLFVTSEVGAGTTFAIDLPLGRSRRSVTLG